MEWQNPATLYLILPLCAGWLALSLYSNRCRRNAREVFAARAMWSRIFPVDSRIRFLIKLLLREVAIVMGLIALAGPRFGIQYEQVIPRGSDLYVLIDVSRSMLADDVLPSRLGRAKSDVAMLVNRLDGERIGLIAFAGQAVVKCPLTIDYDSFRRALDELDPDSAPRGGTAIGDAIRKALEVFLGKSDRDQAILLITDGDDQQSYPLEAAATAAEQHVTIFTVGLGDAERGARVPQKSDARNYVEYQGEQVWSKLDGNLLQQIALKTSGVYVPAGTRSYDLSELYANYLQGRRGSESTAEKKIRRSERFQLFLAIGLICLLLDLCIVPYRNSVRTEQVDGAFVNEPPSAFGTNSSRSRSMLARTVVFLTISVAGGAAYSEEPAAAVRDGLRLYSKDQFDEAKEKFSAASEEFEKLKLTARAAIAAFDEACSLHRKGDFEHARDSYLRAGLSQDQSIATAAHFNLGNLSAEKARQLSGDKPETVPAEKRQEILDQLSQAIVAYRHCLELQPDHAPSRRNLELVRQWIKFYSDQWHELDRQKRRDDLKLLEFLEFMMQTQSSLRNTIDQLPANAHADAYAELKRAQEELREEIPTLRDKIAEALRPQANPGAPSNPADDQKAEEGIAMLREWADIAGRKMSSAAASLQAREKGKASKNGQDALDELDKIWDAVVPFHPLLSKLVNDQTLISQKLNPKPTADNPESDGSPEEPPDKKAHQTINDDDEFQKLEKEQSRTLNRTRLLAPKAEMELNRVENSPSPPPAAAEKKPGENVDGQPANSVDTEQLKAGLRKAIELAPQAAEEMESAVKALRQKDGSKAASPAEEARRILEEIQKSQPKNPQNQDQKNQDQKQQQDQQSQDQKQENDQTQDSQKQQNQKGEDQPGSDQPSQDKKSQDQMSQDQIANALRKVRERQQEKRERDRKLRAQFLGKTPVEKDW